MVNDIGIEKYVQLGNAIVLQAIHDFKKNIVKLVRDNYTKTILPIRECKSCLSFLDSDWYGKLTKVKPIFIQHEFYKFCLSMRLKTSLIEEIFGKERLEKLTNTQTETKKRLD